MKDRSSIGVGHHYEIGALADVGGNPIELHLLFVPECEINGAPQEPRSPGRTGADRLLANPRGSSATQLFSKKITNKGMSVQFPRVVRVFPPGAWPSLIGKGASATPPGSTPLRTRSGRGMASGFSRDLSALSLHHLWIQGHCAAVWSSRVAVPPTPIDRSHAARGCLL